MADNDPNMQAQIPQQPEFVQISAKEFASKYRNKRECYHFVAVTNKYYVPPYGKS